MLIKTTIKVGVLLICTVFFACSKKTNAGIYKNNEIDNIEKEKVAQLNKQLISSLFKKDVVGVKKLLSDELLKKFNDNAIELIDKVGSVMKNESYTVMDEYLIIHNQPNITTVIPYDDRGDSSYSLSFQTINDEIYTSLLLIKNDNFELLVTAIYGRYFGEWKLNVLNFGQISVFGKSAPDYFKLCKQNYSDSNYADLTINLRLLNECLLPSENYFNYRILEDAKKFTDSVMNELNKKFSFPIVLNTIPSKPELISFTVEVLEEKPIPAILYKSNISFKDTNALKAEYLLIKNEAAKLYKGVDKTQRTVLYRAFNELPSDGNSVPYKNYFDKH